MTPLRTPYWSLQTSNTPFVMCHFRTHEQKFIFHGIPSVRFEEPTRFSVKTPSNPNETSGNDNGNDNYRHVLLMIHYHVPRKGFSEILQNPAFILEGSNECHFVIINHL